MKSNSDRKKWLLPILSAPLIFAFIGLLSLFKPRQLSWQEQGRQFSSTNAFGIWAAATYSPIVPGEPLKKQVEQFEVIATNINLSEPQITKLRESTYNLIMTFNTGDYDYYKKFRRPVSKGRWNEDLYNFRKSTLQKLWRANPLSRTADHETVDRYFYELMGKTTRYDPDGFNIIDSEDAGFLTALSPENCKFFVNTRSNLPPSLDLLVTSFENDGYLLSTPSFTFELMPDTLLKRHGSVTFAVTKLLVKSKRDRPMPLFYRHYWCDEYQEWLPFQHCVPFTNRRTNYTTF